MPRKGWKKPEAPKPTQCATCGLLLTHLALRGVLAQLRTVAEELRKRPDEGASADEARRHTRFRVLHAQGAIGLIVEDEALFCFGHEERAKPGPKTKTKPSGDPSFPADTDTPKPRAKPGRKPRALQIVADGGRSASEGPAS